MQHEAQIFYLHLLDDDENCPFPYKHGFERAKSKLITDSFQLTLESKDTNNEKMGAETGRAHARKVAGQE